MDAESITNGIILIALAGMFAIVLRAIARVPWDTFAPPADYEDDLFD